MLAAIDLHGGDRTRLADPDSIRGFVPALTAAIGMRAHGRLGLDRFGDDELEGWSAMQFIETSWSPSTPTRYLQRPWDASPPPRRLLAARDAEAARSSQGRRLVARAGCRHALRAP
jgi:hypothetical protein